MQKSYFANILVIICKLSHIFYEIDFLFKYQNNKFKRFYTRKKSFLQETNQVFCLLILSVDTFSKIKLEIN